MDNFDKFFTVKDDADYFYCFRFDERNKSFDDLPSHLANKLISVYDFTDCSSSDDYYADGRVETPILLTVIFDLLHELEIKLDGHQRYLSLNANFNGLKREIIKVDEPIFLSSEPYVYEFRNLTYQECFQLVLIDGKCRLNTYKKSQESEAGVLRDCVWNLLWGVGHRRSFYEDMGLMELERRGIDPGKLLDYHLKMVRDKIGSYLGSSGDSWILENGLKSAQKIAIGRIETWDDRNPDHLYIPDFTDADVMEVLELVRLISKVAGNKFKKRFEIAEPETE